MKKEKIVPSIWYKEMANELAIMAISVGAKNGINSLEYKNAKEKWQSFKKQYKPSKTKRLGNLICAKKQMKKNIKKIQNAFSIKDYFDVYNYIGEMMDKYYLSNSQTDKLMSYADKLKLLY